MSHWLLEDAEIPELEEPKDISKDEEKVKWKVRLWNQKVDNYRECIMVKMENEKALYSLISRNLSKMTKSKVISTQGHAKAEKGSDLKWLLDTLDDIMIGCMHKMPCSSR